MVCRTDGTLGFYFSNNPFILYSCHPIYEICTL